jgi:CRISPR/Cas system CMR subunit Cmr6 (Cas7 group RAMP superfamily)
MTLHKNYPFPVYSDSTLKGMTKEMLIGEIHRLENNLASAYQRNDVQVGYIDFFWQHSSDEVKNKFIKEGGHYVEVKENGALIEY